MLRAMICASRMVATLMCIARQAVTSQRYAGLRSPIRVRGMAPARMRSAKKTYFAKKP